MSTYRTVAVAIAAATALSLSACANNAASPANTPAPTAGGGTAASTEVALVNPGKLTVCTHLAYKPFQFTDTAGKIVGFDVDVMDLVADELGVEQEIIDIEFGQITSGAVFAAKRCDAGAAAITITDARKESTGFSPGYFDATQALLVKADSDIADLPDLQGKTLAVQTDTTGKDYAEEKAAEFGYTTRVFEDMPSGSNAVLAGTVDASINDNGVLYDFAKDNPTTKVVKEFQTGEQYGFNYGKDNTALGEVLEKVLTDAKADGRYNDIYKKWFGVDAPKS